MDTVSLQKDLWRLAVKTGVDVGLQSITVEEGDGGPVALVSTMYVAAAEGGTSFRVDAALLKNALASIPKTDCARAFDEFINSPGIREHVSEEFLR